LNLFYLGVEHPDIPHHGTLEKAPESNLISATLQPQPKYTYEQSSKPTIAMPIPPSLDVKDPSLPMSRTLELATHPNLPSIALISPLLPWAIMVHVCAINPVFVTMADVLCTIYRGGI